LKRAIWSRVYLDEKNRELAELFYECVSDLTAHKMVKDLDNFSQHVGTSRLQHSINVAYYSFLICRKFGLDYRSAARAGILHDLFLYDWRKVSKSVRVHIYEHPKAALENAHKITELNEKETDAILTHMWPMTPAAPKFRESYIVSLVDTFCAMAEVLDRYRLRVFGLARSEKLAKEQ